MAGETRSYRDPVFEEVAAREARAQRKAAQARQAEALAERRSHTERWIKRLKIRALIAGRRLP
ncbi:hypothetical protein [Crenobacter caeni]|uniref:Uncharacterized protein n=1 Tax=Crenobacter caeni TaxID=2705474 RepID=A0A6B2KN45_9NEIS|nr:hypothetical protein [Crenobacter caeni]NDV11656.1 hypothetical protein [Crenobacter caeni]